MKVALFGAGRYLTAKSEKILGSLKADILYICDNDSRKWGGGGERFALECVSPERLIEDRPYVIITIDSEKSTERVREQCSIMRVQARSYKELVRERSYLTDWNRIDYASLLMSCAIKGRAVEDELHKLKKTTGKKLLMFYGNCQCETLSTMSCSSAKIGEKYFILDLPPIQDLSANEREYGIHQGVLNNLDVVFFQHVNYGNRFSRNLGSEAITQAMNMQKQVKICIPNVFYSGYFPQLTINRYCPVGVGKYNVGAGPFPGDANIERMWRDSSIEEIVERISDEEFYSADTVLNHANASMEALKRHEELCDVIISDYICDNLRRERICFIPNHPKNKVIHELLRRAFVKIGIDVDDVKTDNIKESDIQAIPIYPSVKKALNLEFVDGLCYEKSLEEKPSNLKQYVGAYVTYCKPLWEKQQLSRE